MFPEQTYCWRLVDQINRHAECVRFSFRIDSQNPQKSDYYEVGWVFVGALDIERGSALYAS
jgi:hypothetical protein